MNEETTPPAQDDPFSTPRPCGGSLNRPFDAAPLLRAVMADDGPSGLAESLDQAYTTLAEYLAGDPGTAGERYAHALYDLRRVRNALLQGGGWLRLKG
ncbi:hypothetical protein GCM10023188_18810 [Pontibacter saemangeumensis]|uniref:Uncharacterized protein n=1 Tax=Pontibacter saemangeumensis TaxID=1084525 RepID=A0ABP8LMS3_9BACT